MRKSIGRHTREVALTGEIVNLQTQIVNAEQLHLADEQSIRNMQQIIDRLRARVEELEKIISSAVVPKCACCGNCSECDICEECLDALRAVAEAAEEHLVTDNIRSGIRLTAKLNAAKEAGAL